VEVALYKGSNLVCELVEERGKNDVADNVERCPSLVLCSGSLLFTYQEIDRANDLRTLQEMLWYCIVQLLQCGSRRSERCLEPFPRTL
jgi:hypothetical protein